MVGTLRQLPESKFLENSQLFAGVNRSEMSIFDQLINRLSNLSIETIVSRNDAAVCRALETLEVNSDCFTGCFEDGDGTL